MFNSGNKMALALKAIDVSVDRSVSRFTSEFTRLSAITVILTARLEVQINKGKKYTEAAHIQAKLTVLLCSSANSISEFD